MAPLTGSRFPCFAIFTLIIGLILMDRSFSGAAEQPAFELDHAAAFLITLRKHVGKQVTVRLKSGHELTGTVAKVGQTAVHLSELAGKEFFDAVVRLDDISALVIQLRGK